MSAQPYPSRLKLSSTARAAGCVVSTEDGVTRIECGDVTLSFSADSDITDGSGKAYSGKEAFEALGLPLQ